MKFLIKRIINIVPSRELTTTKVKFSINGPSSLITWTQIRPTADSDLDPKLFDTLIGIHKKIFFKIKKKNGKRPHKACKITQYARKRYYFTTDLPAKSDSLQSYQGLRIN